MDPDVFRCPICLDIVKDAVEVECCGHVFCEVCIDGVVGRSCPHCRSNPYEYRDNMSVRRALESMKVKCDIGCEFTGSLNEVDQHVKICPKKEYTCPAETCCFKSTKTVFAAHVADAHVDILVKNIEKMLVKDHETKLESVASLINANGRLSRLGATGKYYCGGKRQCVCEVKPDEGSACNKGNRICGYRRGCNCQACQTLDVRVRSLDASWFVNNEGSPCQRSEMNQLFYCGRRQFPDSDSTRLDAYCGPRQGSQCDACSVLQKHVTDGIYK